jgi:transcriptional regulator with XRE-family HTH domain
MNVVKNIIKIRKQKGINQDVIADTLSVDVSTISNIEKGKRELRVSELENIANVLGVNILYLFTYPDVYEKKKKIKDSEPIETVLQIKLQADKKEQILKLVLGENNFEIYKQYITI